MTRTRGKYFLGFECSQVLYEIVSKEASGRKPPVTISALMREITTEWALSHKTGRLMEFKEDDKGGADE